MKSLFLFLLVIIFSGCSKIYYSEEHRFIPNKVLLKQYSFCRRLESAYPNDSSLQNDYSRGVLFNISNFSFTPEMSSELDEFSDSFAGTISPPQLEDFRGKTTAILQCLHFYESRSLDSFVSRLLKDNGIEKDNWDKSYINR